MTTDAFLDRLLLSYATGNIGTQEALVVATLLALNDSARRKVARFEALGGRVIEDENPAGVRQSCLDSVLRRIDGGETPPATKTPPREYRDIPDPLYSLFLSCDEGQAGCWERARSGVQRMELRISAPSLQNLFLMKLAPSSVMPMHGHTGFEITVVLEGSYSDAFGAYKKGDVSVIADERVSHSLMAGPQGCLCLVLTEGPLRFEHPLLRFLHLLTR